MEIYTIRHKGLRRFVEKNDPSGLPAAAVEKIRAIVSFLEAMGNVEELYALPTWRVHRLTGDSKSLWSLSVTRNWRLTFAIDTEENAIIDLDYQDYH
jgi:proteic killer suppression protein